MNDLVTDPAIDLKMTDAEWHARVELAACYRLMAAFGFHDLTYNHLSSRIPDAPDHYLIKGEEQLFEQVTASSLLLYDFQGQKLRPSPYKVSPGGLVIHGGVMEGRADIHAVFHTHSTANMAVSAQKCGLLPICQQAMNFYNRIAYHDFGGFEFNLSGRERLLRDLEGVYTMIMRNHGVLVCGRTVPEAYVRHHQLEMSCRMQIAALSAGGVESLVIPSHEVCEYAARQSDRGVITAEGRDWPALLAYAKQIAPNFDS
jgi:ribulose-5-phosphate 4-epimerase/fuculose-1-phosphate aldolase